MKTYTPTIGLEIHAELKTKTKMFCSSKNDPHDSSPNTHICAICMGHPGTLPVVNKTAVMHVLKVGKALNGEIATYTEFDRKNYFYPDIPKGYQISQYLYPLIKGGELSGVQITRVHLEEDTARSLHDQGDGSIVDYNRAGVPLMELVTEPVIHDAKTAGTFARELQLLLRTLGVSDANMERGEMRVEANISVSPDDVFGTKVEVKNLNSFKSVEGAIEYEIERHIKVLEEGGTITQETRGWDESKGKTFSQRVKETANDYRYFPDPDIPKFSFDLSRLDISIPELPAEKRSKYEDIGIPIKQIDVIISNTEITSFFEKCIILSNSDSDLIRLASNYLTSDIFSIMSQLGSIDDWNAEQFMSLMTEIKAGSITSRVAKDLLPEVIKGSDPKILIKERGLEQTSSSDVIEEVVVKIIAENPNVVAEFKAGKQTALQFLVGQGMKATKGSANPKLLIEILQRELSN